eukprot:5760110-Pleurochrysis_carterae.AAC.3
MASIDTREYAGCVPQTDPRRKLQMLARTMGSAEALELAGTYGVVDEDCSGAPVSCESVRLRYMEAWMIGNGTGCWPGTEEGSLLARVRQGENFRCAKERACAGLRQRRMFVIPSTVLIDSATDRSCVVVLTGRPTSGTTLSSLVQFRGYPIRCLAIPDLVDSRQSDHRLETDRCARRWWEALSFGTSERSNMKTWMRSGHTPNTYPPSPWWVDLRSQ